MKLTVKAARVNSGVSRERAAAELKISVWTYGKKENGKSRFYADELAKLSILFKTPYDYFFDAGCPKKTQKDGGSPLVEFPAIQDSIEGRN